ncbi:MAG: phytanoyl-CoA dioxygenase family protein [Pirellulaceae bacterium]
MTTDLSTRHELVGELLELPQSAEAWRQHQLSDEQLTFYQENGYLAGVRILTHEQVDMLREELQEFFDPQHAGRELWYEYHANESVDPGTVLFHALGAWRIRAGFHDVLWHPAFTVAASQLLGGAVRFWHDQLFCKPARHGGVVAWHQDYSYWTRTKPLAHLTCWIGLDDSTRDNGCLHYVPGSHQWDLLPITGLAGDMDAIREALDEEQWETFKNPVAVELKKGECSFHHGLTIHGSFENSSERPRRAVVINTIRDGVRSASDEPPLVGVPPIPSGQPMRGPFFPLLLDPRSVGLD